MAENGSDGIPSNPIKQARVWFANDTTKDLIQECLDQTHLEFVHYKLHAGTRNAFKGTYVHELLYDQDVSFFVKIANPVSKLYPATHIQPLKPVLSLFSHNELLYQII